MRAHAIEIGEWVTLEFLSGITVCGRLQEVCRQEQRNLILSFDECTVHDLAGRVLFEPSWGCYDMAVGSQVDSVYGGTADRERYRLYEPSATVTPHAAPADPQLMALYEAVAGSLGSVQGAEALVDQLSKYPDEWLLRHELRQTLSALEGDTAALRARLADDLQGIAQRVPELAALVALVQAD